MWTDTQKRVNKITSSGESIYGYYHLVTTAAAARLVSLFTRGEMENQPL